MAMNYGKIDNFIVDNDVMMMMTIAEKKSEENQRNFLMNVTMKMTLRKDVIFSCR